MISRPAAIVLLITFLASIVIPIVDQRHEVVATHEGQLVRPIQEQGKYRVNDSQLWIELDDGRRILASYPAPRSPLFRDGSNVTVEETRSLVLHRKKFRVVVPVMVP